MCRERGLSKPAWRHNPSAKCDRQATAIATPPQWRRRYFNAARQKAFRVSTTAATPELSGAGAVADRAAPTAPVISVVAPASAIRKLRGSRLRPEELQLRRVPAADAPRRAFLSLPKHLPCYVELMHFPSVRRRHRSAHVTDWAV